MTCERGRCYLSASLCPGGAGGSQTPVRRGSFTCLFWSEKGNVEVLSSSISGTLGAAWLRTCRVVISSPNPSRLSTGAGHVRAALLGGRGEDGRPRRGPALPCQVAAGRRFPSQAASDSPHGASCLSFLEVALTVFLPVWMGFPAVRIEVPHLVG